MCFVWTAGQQPIISINSINWLVAVMERYWKHTLLILVTKEPISSSWVYCYKELQGPSWYKQYLIIHFSIILSFEFLKFMRVRIIVKSVY
jgi:hypothetical protein